MTPFANDAVVTVMTFNVCAADVHSRAQFGWAMKKQRAGTLRLDSQRLERLQIQRGMSQLQLAKKAQISRGTLNNILMGASCYPQTAKLLADALGVELSYLIQEEGGGLGIAPFAIPGTEEWEVVEIVRDWRPTSNGLQFRICRMRHKSDPRQWGRGKFYDLLGLAASQSEKIRHYLPRHFQVCGRVSSHDHVAENLSCVSAPGNTGWWVIDRWIEGRPLSEFLGQNPWPVQELVLLMTQIAEGLATLHEAGVIFRELAPSHVLIAGKERRVVLTDFELAKLLEEAPSVSAEWPDDPYRAPEVEGGHATVKSDVFSWAKVLVHAVAGHLPSPGKEKEILSDLPRSLRDLAVGCLSASFRKRPTVAEVLNVLRQQKRPSTH